MRILIKTPENVKNKQNCQMCKFSRNPIYPLPREGLFPQHVSGDHNHVPGASLISSN